MLKVILNNNVDVENKVQENDYVTRLGNISRKH